LFTKNAPNAGGARLTYLMLADDQKRRLWFKH